MRSRIKPIGYLGHVIPLEVKDKANRLPGSCNTFEVKDKAFRLPKGPDVETFMRTNLLTMPTKARAIAF